ncbi:MAG: hypothetical protein WC227_01210 [Patescibacteria group bacterium]|jgi:hypothetical protein
MIKLEKRTKVQLIVVSCLAIMLAGVFLAGTRGFLRKKADTISTDSNQLTAVASLTYQNADGDSMIEQSQSVVTLVSPLTIKAQFRGKSVANDSPEVFFDFIDSSSSQSVEKMSATSVGSDEFQADWTSKSEIDPAKTLDLRVSSPGYLSRKFAGISLLEASPTVNSASLIAGDINQDRRIDWQDYFTWKSSYGQNTTSNLSDFNGDGVVNYKDYAVSFGTHCYNATEANQDIQCQ